ncbi:hypothetical protein TRFO_35620 [Tritrichomonas foetus]|uniref:Zinc finger Sec23/Sec24-type domain-containing protein n=1 Tax=Tritrichomonas foetus TaxID=1144522 RepID=A0A1J4JLA8_9EUKA|nr:hypothetical protein TRFO_35620 [Tritrichomonas foetus]|eukprot:OHS98052.1 hypothetical protein TRFO_35620 [Tritrichomonas foetus]
MEKTTQLLPKTEELKKKIRIPLGFTYSPCAPSNNLAKISCDQSSLYICSKCRSFLSPNCITNGAIWNCGICGAQNQGNRDDIYSTLSSKESVEILLKSTKEIGQVFILYFSLDFEKPIDFMKAKVAAFSIVRHLPENSKCLFIIGSDSTEFSLLIPPNRSNSMNEQNQFTKIEIASAVRFSSIQSIIGLDLTKFFFTRDTAKSAEIAIDRLQVSPDSNPHQKSLNLAKILSGFLNPIRFISIINEVTRKPVDIEPLLQTMCRVDFIVANINSRALDLAKNIPGTVSILSNHNSAAQAEHLIKQDTKFQIISSLHHRANDFYECKWQKPPRPYIDTNDKTIFSPVLIGNSHPLIADLTFNPNYKPNNNSNSIPNNISIINARNNNVFHFQIVSKYFYIDNFEKKFILRIENFSYDLTVNFDDFLNSINWNSVLYFWSRKVYGLQHDEAMASILKVAAVVIKQCGGFDKINPDFIKGVCSLSKGTMFSNKEDEYLEGTNLLIFAPPSTMKLIPTIQNEKVHGNNVCESINGISESRGTANTVSPIAKSLQQHLPIYLPIASPIQSEFMKTSITQLSLLEKLVQKSAV